MNQLQSFYDFKTIPLLVFLSLLLGRTLTRLMVRTALLDWTGRMDFMATLILLLLLVVVVAVSAVVALALVVTALRLAPLLPPLQQLLVLQGMAAMQFGV